jgi:hypothetical protein
MVVGYVTAQNIYNGAVRKRRHACSSSDITETIEKTHEKLVKNEHALLGSATCTCPRHSPNSASLNHAEPATT